MLFVSARLWLQISAEVSDHLWRVHVEALQWPVVRVTDDRCTVSAVALAAAHPFASLAIPMRCAASCKNGFRAL